MKNELGYETHEIKRKNSGLASAYSSDSLIGSSAPPHYVSQETLRSIFNKTFSELKTNFKERGPWHSYDSQRTLIRLLGDKEFEDVLVQLKSDNKTEQEQYRQELRRLKSMGYGIDGANVANFHSPKLKKTIDMVILRQLPFEKLFSHLGHEVGHVMTPKLSENINEEAKAYAFGLIWDIVGLKLNVEVLGKEIFKPHLQLVIPKISYKSGETPYVPPQSVAQAYVDKRFQSDRIDLVELFLGLADGSIKLDDEFKKDFYQRVLDLNPPKDLYDDSFRKPKNKSAR